jgi:2-dehydro-3-deoxy-D-arabinonate dehydratase
MIMRLIQFSLPGKGRRLGVLSGDGKVIDITTDEVSSTLELLKLAESEGVSLSVIAAEMEEEVSLKKARQEEDLQEFTFSELNVLPESGNPHLLKPIDPPEIWGCNAIYRRTGSSSPVFGSRAYMHAEESDRPSIFFKGTASRCSGPNENVSIRSDSNHTVPGPSLAYSVGGRGRVMGYTIANDLCAWDIENENPLFLSQARIYGGSCAIGPMIVTTSEVTDPSDLVIKCRIIRNEELIFEESSSTDRMMRTIDSINVSLHRDNPVPIGTTIATGSAMMVPGDLPLADGDIVEIEITEIGCLRNPVTVLRSS